MELRGRDVTLCAAMLGVACGLAIAATGCADSAGPASGAAAHAAGQSGPRRFCADEIATLTAAEQAAINRYWTPLARSALVRVSRGKMIIPVPRQHLTGAQSRALRRAEWAERAFTPKPKQICSRLP